jgi:antitoxin VapB
MRIYQPESDGSRPARSTVFKTNRTQAVRLPKAVAFPEEVREVEIIVVGRSRVISPVGHRWDGFFDGPRATPDFMTDRQQPPADERDPL